MCERVRDTTTTTAAAAPTAAAPTAAAAAVGARETGRDGLEAAGGGRERQTKVLKDVFFFRSTRF